MSIDRISKEDFRELTGRDPEHDDLARTNCPDAGTTGHFLCCICPNCGIPRFVCGSPSYETEEEYGEVN